MSATVTVDLDSEIMALAEQEARTRKTTISAIVSQQLTVMAHNWSASQAGQTPITDSLRGSVKLPVDFNHQSLLADELGKQHGV